MNRRPGPDMRAISRRTALIAATGLAVSAMLPVPLRAAASGRKLRLQVAARSPQFLCNAVALTRDNTMFLGLPRWPGMERSPALVKVGAGGALQPFPGGEWNAWQPGKDPREALVMVNGIHVFADDTLWVVDQGTADRESTMAGAQKLVQFDSATGKVLNTLRFGPDILPQGAQMNDLRISGTMMYVTDSGLGAIIAHDMATGATVRRLAGKPSVLHTPGKPLLTHEGQPLEDENGKRPLVHADMLEVTADGRWLYFCTPTGPLRRIETAALRDPAIDDDALEAKVETVAQIPTIMGTAIDTLGNLYYTDAENRRIVLRTPAGETATLIQDDRLIDGDAMFITADRHLYIPAAQTEGMSGFNRGRNGLRPPWTIFRLALPRSFAGHPLGDAVTR